MSIETTVQDHTIQITLVHPKDHFRQVFEIAGMTPDVGVEQSVPAQSPRFAAWRRAVASSLLRRAALMSA